MEAWAILLWKKYFQYCYNRNFVLVLFHENGMYALISFSITYQIWKSRLSKGIGFSSQQWSEETSLSIEWNPSTMELFNMTKIVRLITFLLIFDNFVTNRAFYSKDHPISLVLILLSFSTYVYIPFIILL